MDPLATNTAATLQETNTTPITNSTNTANNSDNTTTTNNNNNSDVNARDASSSAQADDPFPKGVCPVKAEYRREAPPRQLLSGGSEGRGMNRGADRERSLFVLGTERPTCEGECNFFAGEVLHRIKNAVRDDKKKSQRNNNNNRGRLWENTDDDASNNNNNNNNNSNNNSSSKTIAGAVDTKSPTNDTNTIASASLSMNGAGNTAVTAPSANAATAAAASVSAALGEKRAREESETHTSTAAETSEANNTTATGRSAESSPSASATTRPVTTATTTAETETTETTTETVGGQRETAAAAPIVSTPISTTTTAMTAAPPPHPDAGVTVEGTLGGGVAGGAIATPDGNEIAAPRERQSAEVLRDLSAARDDQRRRRGLFTNKLILAPLTTVGNLPFRRVCKTLGADVTLSEMAVVYNLNKMQKTEWSLLRRHESEDLFGIQIAVAKPQDAAVFATALNASGFSYDFLDINCGCPVDVINKNGCGCALWEKKGRLREVVRNLATRQPQPVSIKCRTGAEEQNPQLHRQIGEYAEWGAAAVTIHGRSRRQRYTRSANWDYISECASLTTLPVIGNGDIMSWEDAAAHREGRQANIASLMIGRAALIKPWIFEEIKSGQVRDISSRERLDLLSDFCRYGLAHWGADERGVLTTRRFLCEWMSFFHRYVPVGLLERLPQRLGDRPPYYEGRDELETLLASDSAADWIRVSEMLLGPAGPNFRFTPKHKSNSYTTTAAAAPGEEGADAGLEGEG